MPTISFSHPLLQPKLGDLHVTTGADEVSWGYELNTQTFPTYGGEVVQILSAYTDNITVKGTVRTYEKMEQIYRWFLEYMQIATQGTSGDSANYVQSPVLMTYKERGWSWKIHPLALPGFRYGLEVVAPTWQMEAAVYEDEAAVHNLNLQAAIEGIEKLTLGIGYEEDNPFSDPFPIKKGSQEKFDIKDIKSYYDESADYFSKLIPAYIDGDYESLFGEIGSKPAFGRSSTTKAEQEREAANG